MLKILIVDKVHPYLSEKLSEKGFLCETDMTYGYDSFLSRPDDVEGLVVRSRFVIDRAMLEQKRALKFIVRIGSGVENIDVAFAQKRGIRVLSTPEGNANAVAEHCLGLLLSALRHIPAADREVRAGEWLREKNKGTELQSHRYGLIGYGHTGAAFARLLHALGCEVYAYDKYHPENANGDAAMVSLETLMQKCDVVSLHVNYMPENKYLIDKCFIERMASPFVLINSSRGLVVNTADVAEALQSGKITTACLDVLEYESTRLKNLPKELWPAAMYAVAASERAILTPHVGGQTADAELRHAHYAVNKILELYA
jgi:D-3-phosphoglycerate dehydrogenase / 2-oxoglutarate reductase